MNKIILEQIKYCRKHRGITLEELSNKTGISKAYLSRLENGGKINPSLIILEKIANVLQVELTFLIK